MTRRIQLQAPNLFDADALEAINEALVFAAALFPLPTLATSGEVFIDGTFGTDDMPADFHDFEGSVYRVENADGDSVALVGNSRDLLDAFEDYSPGEVEGVAIDGTSIYGRPLPSSGEMLTVYYHKLPTTLTEGTDSPSYLPAHTHEGLLVRPVVYRYFREVAKGGAGFLPDDFAPGVMALRQHYPNVLKKRVRAPRKIQYF